MKTILKSFLLLSAFQFFSVSAFSQGSLTPPGPPASTMKTLQQIEPRADLQASPAPAGVDTTNANYHFIINQPGSYYLSANLPVTKTNGIQINAEGVTLDLNGFEISRASGSGGRGIEIVAAGHRASVRNGSVKGFTSGIIALSGAHSCAFRDLSLRSCTGTGISAGESAVLESCRAYGNTGLKGIIAGDGSSLSNCTANSNTITEHAIFVGNACTLINCTATNNTGPFAIGTGSGCSLTNCTAFNNTGEWGISVGTDSSLTNCSASINHSSAGSSGGFLVDINSTITHCTASDNDSTLNTSTSGMGFLLKGNIGSSTTMQSCTAARNKGDGIQAVSKCTITGCTASLNGSGTVGSGISVTTESTITDSGATGNRAHGFSVGASSTLTNCTASGNVNGYGINGSSALTAVKCTVSSNGLGGITGAEGSHIESCALYKNTGPAALTVTDGSSVSHCTVRQNNGDGVKFTTGCRIVENNCDFNGQNSVTGAGLHCTGGGCRIEGNNLTGNFNYGLKLDSTGNTVFRNSTHGNSTAAFDNPGGNDVGPTGTAAASTNPWANIAY